MSWNLEKLQQQYSRMQKMKYIFFWGHRAAKDGSISKSCFSQWWPCEFSDQDHTYRNAEQYMMAEKARLFNDQEIRAKILQNSEPGKIKALGREIQHFQQEIWDQEKFNIVKRGNYLKFSQNEDLKEFLLGTKERILVEASPVDKIWGIGLAEDNPAVDNPFLWKGENLLGFALMEVREELREV